MMKCKQAFMYGPFDLRIEEVELPDLKPDQILIQIGACGFVAQMLSALKENRRKAATISRHIPPDTNGRAKRLRSAVK